jgi:hypothetical protein
MLDTGVTAVPCASGWCGKVIESEKGAFREDGEKNFQIKSLKNSKKIFF